MATRKRTPSNKGGPYDWFTSVIVSRRKLFWQVWGKRKVKSTSAALAALVGYDPHTPLYASLADVGLLVVGRNTRCAVDVGADAIATLGRFCDCHGERALGRCLADEHICTVHLR